MGQVASRLITLIFILQRQPNQKATELAERLGVSVRTLHRYMGMLDEMGIPVYSERGPNGGFSLVRGYQMPPLVLSPEEATAVYLGASLVEEIWGGMYREAAQGALARLDNLLPDEQRQEIAWARRSLGVSNMHRSDLAALAPTLEKLRRAMREHRRVSILYHSGSQPQPGRREIDPYGLALRWGWWYVVGFCHLRAEIRSFRVDRIQAIELSAQVFQPPEGFDIQSYMASSWKLPPQVQVRMRFAPEAAPVAHYHRASWEWMEDQPDGAVLVQMNAPDLAWAANSVLAFGPVVKVLEPAALQALVCEWARLIAANYSGG